MPYDYSRKYDAINQVSSSSISEDSYTDAASEKELVGVFAIIRYYPKILSVAQLKC